MSLDGVIPGVEIKPGAVVLGMQAVMVRGCITIGQVYRNQFEAPCVLTSGVEGRHSATSLHYKGLAADFRTRNVPAERRAALRDAVKAAVGPGFDVILESDHLHVEWDPK